IEVLNCDGHPVATVVGAGHDSPSEGRNLVPGFPDSTPSGIPAVGLLHTYVTSAKSVEQHDRYAPCSSKDLESRHYAYWALGHVHEHQRVEGGVEAWYPGILQGRHPGETGSKGGLLVTIPDRGPTVVEFQPFSRIVWETLVLDQLGNVGNLSEIRGLAGAAFEGKRRLNPLATEWMLRIELEGPCPLTNLLEDRSEVDALQDDLREFLRTRHVEIRTRRIAPVCDVNCFRGDVHVLSEILDVIEEAEGNEDLMQELSPDVLAGPIDEFRDRLTYLRELMVGLDHEAIKRLVEQADAC
ncbi:MAG: metallophosphoesterase family protein, partial [bacterium]